MKYWIISSMDTVPKEGELVDVVATVHWRRDAKEVDGDKEYYGDVYGAQGFAAPHEAAFTPYADLTFEQVCGWLESALDVSALDMALDSQIENQKNPPIVQLPLPWVPAAIQESTEETPSNSL
jgi:hypothetical protein